MKVHAHQVAAPTKKKRTYAQNMLTATTAEGLCPTNSATVDADFFGAPVIAGGGYNWCHLIGHGAGGSDAATNILAGSTHCNSEQLQIEKIAYAQPIPADARTSAALAGFNRDPLQEFHDTNLSHKGG